MIIDMHAHVAFHELYSNKIVSDIFLSRIKGMSIEKKQSFIKFLLNDKSCDSLIKQMNEAGISKTVLLIIDSGLNTIKEMEKIYCFHYEILKKHPERFIVFAGAHPNRGKQGIDLIKKGITEFGFKGIKLHPKFGFKSNCTELEPVYKLCLDYKLPVTIHTEPLKTIGFIKNDLYNIYRVAKRYSQINFILAHTGYLLSQPIIRRIASLPNVFLDLSGYYWEFKRKKNTYNALKYIFTEKYNHKILFGTDWPINNLMTTLKDMTAFFHKNNLCHSHPIALDNILYNNAKSLLK